MRDNLAHFRAGTDRQRDRGKRRQSFFFDQPLSKFPYRVLQSRPYNEGLIDGLTVSYETTLKSEVSNQSENTLGLPVLIILPIYM